jgi:hypothetical protein
MWKSFKHNIFMFAVNTAAGFIAHDTSKGQSVCSDNHPSVFETNDRKHRIVLYLV